jgi:hypothetical protein
MRSHAIRHLRLRSHGLDQPRFAAPADVVAWFGAVQAQEYAHAKWALSLRLPPTTDAALERAFAEGAILRTHVMRPTWHFVAPADIRWLLELTAPRVNLVNGHMYRQLELDEALLRRSAAVIERALAGGAQLTREELGEALARAGIAAAGMRLGYIVHRAELDALICSGPRRGKRFTYMLLAERAPQAGSLPREEALAELTRRFYTSHGPATVDDFAWWSGLTKADVRLGIELAGSALVGETIDGVRYWRAAALPPAREAPAALLLPPYDEYTIAYRDHRALLEPAFADQPTTVIFNGVIAIDGVIRGSWRRSLDGRAVVVETAPFRPLTGAEQEAVSAAIGRLGAFLELPPTEIVRQEDEP